MSYRILPYTKRRAKQLGLEVKSSRVKGKKIDAYRNGKKVASVGATGYKDYPTYMELEKRNEVPKGTANKKRRSYKARHNQHRNKKHTNSWYADKLLW